MLPIAPFAPASRWPARGRCDRRGAADSRGWWPFRLRRHIGQLAGVGGWQANDAARFDQHDTPAALGGAIRGAQPAGHRHKRVGRCVTQAANFILSGRVTAEQERNTVCGRIGPGDGGVHSVGECAITGGALAAEAIVLEQIEQSLHFFGNILPATDTPNHSPHLLHRRCARCEKSGFPASASRR